MEKPISKLFGKLKLTDSGSVKSKKKHDSVANNSNNSNANTASSSGGSGGGVASGMVPPAATTPSVVVPPSRPGQGPAAPGGGAGGSGCGLGLVPTPPSSAGVSDVEQQPPLHPSTLAPLRRRSPQQRASCYLGEGVDSHLRRESGLGPEVDPLGSRGSLNHRRYSLELQQLVRRQQLLSQTPPPLSVPPPYPASGFGSALRGGGGGGLLAEPGYISEPERHKRLSLQESLFYKRLSTGGELWESNRPASLSHPPHRTCDVMGGGGGGLAGGFFYPTGSTVSPRSSFSLQESVLVSPRSSFASSTASGGGGGGGCGGGGGGGGGSPMGSRCSSNRTSGISLGYDSRYSASGVLPLLPLQQQQQQSPCLHAGGPPGGYGAAGRAGMTPVEVWTQYLDQGLRPVAHDSRHSYPPAVGSPAAACYQGGPEWWDEQQQAEARARYSDLPGTRYQEELTRLLLRDAAREGERLPDCLKLMESKASRATMAPTKTPEEPGVTGAKEAPENRQEYFGEIGFVFVYLG